ncbi:MAG: hypothetical protein Q9179_007949 [Wetmoreana sp. 5 TL-2023]
MADAANPTQQGPSQQAQNAADKNQMVTDKDAELEQLRAEKAELEQLRADKAASDKRLAEVEEANAQLRISSLQVSREVDFERLSFGDKLKTIPRPPQFNHKEKGTALTHITREYAWLSKLGVKPEQWVDWCMDNLSSPDFQKVKDQLKQHGESVDTVSHDQFRQLFLSLYGELDPDSTHFRKYLAVKQGSKSMQTYCQEYQNALARLSEEVALSNFVKCFFFLEHMEKTFADRLAVNPNTLGSWKSFPELLQAARALGSATRHTESATTQSGGKSGQKRPSDGQGSSEPPAKKGSSKVAETPTRSAAEIRYLRSKGMCFHCMSNQHTSRRCDQKVKGIAAKSLPSEFKAADWPADQSSSKG